MNYSKTFLVVLLFSLNITIFCKQQNQSSSAWQNISDRIDATIVAPISKAKQKFAAKVRHRINQKEHELKENIKHRAEHAAIHGAEDVAKEGAYVVLSGGIKGAVKNSLETAAINKAADHSHGVIEHQSKWDTAMMNL